jgi:hypothetical protein
LCLRAGDGDAQRLLQLRGVRGARPRWRQATTTSARRCVDFAFAASLNMQVRPVAGRFRHVQD